MDGIALPKAKTRRKRRRPLSPHGWLAFFFVVCGLWCLGSNLLDLNGHDDAIDAMWIAISCICIIEWWPVLLTEIRRTGGD